MINKNNKKIIENQLGIVVAELAKEKITILRTANQCIEDAMKLPALKKNFGTFWFSGDLVILAGDTGVGKTLLAVLIAIGLTSDQNQILGQEVEVQVVVLYYDFELREEHFLERYRNFKFSNILYRSTFNKDYEGKDQFSIDIIKEDIEKTGAKVVIIDNITVLESKTTQDAETAKKIINELNKLRKRGISILVLAHTPKIPRGIPIDINHLAGSKYLANLVDSVFFIARSSESPKYRYLKNMKPRNTEDTDQVVVIEVYKDDNLLGFRFVKVDEEINHIKSLNSSEKDKMLEQVMEMINQNIPYREIAKELGIPKSTVSNWNKKYRKRSRPKPKNGTKNTKASDNQ
ncbi:MAG: AAA family ATPase [Bacteroidales bacterium]|jgi:predicted ATP-dependent serine protease|nr:AAA family ATPase [Bacteroidales bacterium]